MQLLIPESLKNNAGGQKKVKLTANDIEEFKKELKEKENALYARIYDEKGNQRKFVNIYLNNNNIKYMENCKIKEDDVLTLITAVAGG